MSLSQDKLKTVFTRRVDYGIPPPQPAEGRPPVNNVVKTSRYSALDFVPRNLIGQFLEPANTYFLIVGILQIIPQTSTSDGIPNMYVPLAFILFVSATRAAIEDYHKHVSDAAESAKQYLVFDHQKKDFVRKASGSIVVGDIVKMTKPDYSDPKHPLTDSFPADLVFLSGANPKGNGFVETASLDGETNLKNRQAIHATHQLIHQANSPEEELDRLSKLKFTVRCEAPNSDLKRFKGWMWIHEAKDVPAAAGTWNKDEGIELKTDCLMLRNTNLRNTTYMYGLVVYTGTETKIRQNISAESKMRIKRSSVMRRVDRMLAGMFVFQFLLCLFGGFYAGIWQNLHKDNWYLKLSGLSDAGEGAVRFFTWFIILSQMVPISLLVSTELVKFGQAIFIAWDNNMYYAPTDKEAVVLSSQLNEDLGQVEYIFTDKTGTLTQNKMEFRVGYVGIEMFGDPKSEIARRVEERMRDCELRQKGQKTAPRRLWNQSMAALLKRQEDSAALGLTEDFIGPNEMTRMAETLWGKKDAAPSDSEKSERIRLYLLHCALSNTITPEPKTESDGKTSLVFQFTSPDELAICKFAQSMGYELTQRTKEAVKLKVRRRGFGESSAPTEQEHVFKQLALLDFNPKRKRVTLIYQEGNRVLVMCKGQDSRVVPLIHTDNEDEKNAISYLQEQLVIMGNKALRTMVMGHAELPMEWWSGRTGGDGRVAGGMEQKWNYLRSLPDAGDEFKHDRGECTPSCRICSTLEEIERAAHMKLIGATCLEDRLQDLVPESIEDFLIAQVKVWMLTGDKLPTAKNIGMACNLIDPDMEKPEPHGRPEKKDLSRLLSVTGRWAVLCKDEKELNFLFGRLAEPEGKEGPPVIARDDLRAFLQRMAFPGMEDDENFNQLWVSVDANRDGKIDEGEFLKFMRNTKLTFWKAVAADLKGAWKRIQAVGEDHLYQLPVSLVIDGAAFNVLYPEKAAAKKAAAPKAEGKVAPNPNGSAPAATPAAAAATTPAGPVVVAAKREESKSQLGGPEKVEGPPEAALEDMRNDFFKITSLCKSVVCCELTPAQKGAIVKQVQVRNSAVTLAIGDGGNDCVMIKTANIGVGIAGVEGVDAARAGEYAIGQFYHLHALLFVHGAWSYRRIAKLVLYIFYKASLVALTMFFFGFFSGFSGQQYLNDVTYQFYNVLFTALPVMVVAIFDQVLTRKTLEDNPEAYAVIRKGALFNTAIFSAWILRATLTALLVFFMVFGSLGQINVLGSDAHTHGLWELSTLSYLIVVCIASLLIVLDMETITWLHHLSVWGSLGVLFLLMYLLNLSSSFNFAMYWVINSLYGSAASWLTLIITVMIPILLDVAIVGTWRLVRPGLIDILKERQKLTPEQLDQMAREIAAAEVVAEGQPLEQEGAPKPTPIVAPITKVRQQDLLSPGGGNRVTDAVVESRIRYNEMGAADFTATPQSGVFEVSKADLAWALAVERDMKEKGAVSLLRRTPSVTLAGHQGVRPQPQLPVDMGDHLRYHDRVDTAPTSLLEAKLGDDVTAPSSVRIVAAPPSS